MLNIWGSWCGPCRAEAPDLQFVAQQTAADGVSVLGVDVRDDRAAAADFVRDRGITYDSVFDPPGRTLAALRGYPRNTVPSTIVLDRQHRVAAVYLTRSGCPNSSRWCSASAGLGAAALPSIGRRADRPHVDRRPVRHGSQCDDPRSMLRADARQADALAAPT